MCGFAGLLNLNSNQIKITSTVLSEMAQAIAHRGPDEQRVWVCDEHDLGFAFRRLSIIDLSPSGMQPMFGTNNNAVTCFNGEIYNFMELRAELENCGYHFHSNSDTETILYAYQEFGINFVHKLVGMFAISIYDFEKRELYLIRDRIGVKPLYFTMQNQVLAFSSEIKAFWQLPWVCKQISEIASYHYLTFMVTPSPYTIYKNIYKLPAGFYLKLDSQKRISFSEWYNPVKKIAASDKKKFASEQFCTENIKNLLFDSVKKRMVADVPVGAFLSGGIDSSLNVALMSQHTSKLKTFTVTFSDSPDTDEHVWARMIAQKFGTDHHEITISEADAFSFYEKMVYHLDEPLADCVCIPFYYVSKLARDNGIVVAQVGEGSDELFFGYEIYGSYKKVYDRFWYPTQKFIPSFARLGIEKLISTLFKNNPTKLDLLQNWARQNPLFWGGALAFNETHKKIILSKLKYNLDPDPIVQQIYPGLRQEFNSLAIVDYHMSKLKEIDPEADFGKQMLYLELKQRLPELLLMRADKMSMAQGLEAREPFLDHKLVEFMLNVPVNLKIKNNTKKYLLKRISRGILPDVVIDRKKVGFAAPTFRWLNNGKFFPAYFEKLSKQSTNICLTSRAIPPENLYKNNIYNFAVQKWVLQNLWAIK